MTGTSKSCNDTPRRKLYRDKAGTHVNIGFPTAKRFNSWAKSLSLFNFEIRSSPQLPFESTATDTPPGN